MIGTRIGAVGAVGFGLFFLSACTPPPADEVFVVTGTGDTVDANVGDGVCADATTTCSLRAAVMEANADPNVTEIQLIAGSTYSLTLPGAGEDAAATGDLDLLEPTYIRAVPGNGITATIDGQQIDRVFDVVSGSFHFLEGLVITGGSTADDGGGLLAHTGLVALEDTRVTDNSAVSGGGIAATGARLWIEDSTIDNNTATNGGGAIMTETFARLFQVTVDGNNGGSGVGGVDLAAGQLQLVSSVVADDAVSLGLVNGSALFINSIVDAPTGCAAGGASVTSQGRNITRDATCGLTGTGDQADTNPLLRPLGDNDGPVPTRLPELNSPAVDAISPGALGCAMPAHPDGRQKPRPVRAGCDIGPVELGGCIIDGVFVENTKAHQFECDALMALYDSTNGPSWTSSAGWGTPTDVCSWYGIACNEDSRPFSLALQNNGLDGTIPPEISGLAAFSGLTLSGDELTGSIPVEVGELVNLRTLALFDTQLSGPIPTEIGNLSDLQYLQLSDNALTGSLPPTLGGLSELLRLQVDGNELSGEFPPALGNLSKLWYLDLRGNSFSGPLPPEFGNLDSLFQAALWDNQFSGDITAAIAGVQDTLVVFLRLISDGPGGNNCLTVTDPGVAAWLDSVDQDWDECDAP